MLTRFRTRRRRLIVGSIAAVFAVGGVASAAGLGVPMNPFGTSQVGTQADGRVLLPDNQWITPYGQRTTLPTESVGTAVSPDGTEVAVQLGGESSHYSDTPASIKIVDAASGNVLQTFGGAGAAAPVYSPDGGALYAATTVSSSLPDGGANSVLKYTVGADGLITNPGSPTKTALPALAGPYGLALSPDGTKLYAALNGTNQLGVVDTTTMQLVDRIRVGQVPQGIAIVGDEAFVSNRGGRVPVAGDTTNDTDGTAVVSDPVTGASTTGTVSVVDLTTDTVTDTINVGLQPTSLTVRDGSVFVTNTNSDTVSIIDAATHQVTQTFNVEPLPGSTVGASPNAVAFADAHHLLVSVGGDNAIAEFGYNGPRTPVRYEGLIPTDWYPNDVEYDAAAGKVIVSNQLGIATDGVPSPHKMKGTVTSFSPPSNLALGSLTSQVFSDNGWDHLPTLNGDGQGGDDNSQGNENGDGALPAIPARLGQPSAIKHVFLIIKENRTYDQILGDIGKGNSDPADTTLGVTDTPNEHSLANTFALFDNFYDDGFVSADGHQYIVQADANDYLQQDQATVYARSYPFPGGDALVYQRDGFLWNTIQATGNTVKNYGEYEAHTSGKAGTWQQYYADSQILEGKATGTLPVPLDQLQSFSDVPSLNAIGDPDYPRYNNSIPDQYRVDLWEQDFQQAEQTGNLPNLTIMHVPDDHTGGTPTAAAQVADNDLAVGRIVSDVSHSRFWKDSAIFVMEDDTQAGVDHVDGHRAPLWIASPYAKRGVVDSSYNTQINVVKTIEQILGAKPMNQMDRAAVPMFDAFTNKPNFDAYDVLPNQIPLTQGVTGLIPLTPTADSSDTPAQVTALAATSGPAAPAVPAAEQSVAAAWASWYQTEAEPKLTGPNAQMDSVNPAQLDRYDWYTTTGWARPYPGDQQIEAPDQVAGRNLPSSLSGD